MDNYKEYLEDRMIGMYEILKESSVLTEGFYDVKLLQEAKLAKKGFFAYMNRQGIPFDRNEIIEARTPEQQEAIRQKYLPHFQKWVEEEDAKLTALTAWAASWVTVGLPPISLIFSFIFFKNGLKWLRERFYNEREDRKERLRQMYEK